MGQEVGGAGRAVRGTTLLDHLHARVNPRRGGRHAEIPDHQQRPDQPGGCTGRGEGRWERGDGRGEGRGGEMSKMSCIK